MRATKKVTSLILFIIIAASIARGDDAKKPQDGVTIPPLRAMKLPAAKELTLKNGVRVFIVEDHELPLVDLHGILRAGDAWDPQDKVGLAALAVEMIRTGGTEKHPGEQLDRFLEAKAASIELGAGEDETSVNVSVLKEDRDLGLELLTELLSTPRLPEDKLEQGRRERISEIDRRDDEGPTIASRLLPMLVFGKESPLARETTRRSLESIKRDDVVRWHRDFVHPKNLIVGIWGDLDAEATAKKLEATLGAWQPATEPAATPSPIADVVRKPSWTLVRKEDVNQSAIVLGHAGSVRSPKDPDYAALVVMNEVLGGGGFGSRLMAIVRSAEGLAYDVHSELGADYDRLGTFQMVCQTKSGSTAKAIRSCLREMERMTKEAPSDEELAIAKESLENMLPLQLDETGKVVSRTLTYAYRRFPLDYLVQFRDAIEKVTKDDVLRVAKSHLHPEAIRAVVVGNPADFDEPLEKVAAERGDAKVEVVLDPETWAHGASAAPRDGGEKSEKPSAKDEGSSKEPAKTTPEARAFVDAMLDAMGGKKALVAVESISTERTLTQKGAPPMRVRQLLRFPDKVRIEITGPDGPVIQGFDGKTGWVKQGAIVQKLPAAVAEQLKTVLELEDLALFRAAARGELSATLAAEKDESLGRAARALTLSRDGRELARFLVDPSTHYVVAKTDAKDGRVVFSDWKPLEGGVMIPRKLDAKDEEGNAVSIVVDKAEANPKIDPAAFAMPPKGKDAPAPAPAPKKKDDDDGE